jgi:branched-chain amino acid transport system ATP-binding protein
VSDPNHVPSGSKDVPALEVRDLSISFGAIKALSEVNLAIMPGQLVGLIGPNGAGKSTLFDALCGLNEPDQGEVWLNGERLPPGRPELRARRGIARTFQHPRLFAGMTTREQLVMADRSRFSRRRLWTDLVPPRAFRKVDQSEDKRVEELIELFSLEEIADRDAMGLPMGLCRLIEVARALATAPDVLLLDEPAAGLDQDETRRLAEALVRTTSLRPIALLLVEHDLEIVLTLSEIVYVLDFGNVIAKGSPAEIRNSSAVRTAYLGVG